MCLGRLGCKLVCTLFELLDVDVDVVTVRDMNVVAMGNVDVGNMAMGVVHVVAVRHVHVWEGRVRSSVVAGFLH